jgi:alkylhydroperoxidase family enzyme
MRLPLIVPAELMADQRPLYENMREGIEKNFKGFETIAENGALMGPWNAWIHEPKFGKPIWELTLALSVSPSLPGPVREVAILVTGAKFRSSYELYAHVIAAERRGLSDDKLTTIVAGQRPSDLTREEAIAYDVASALVDYGTLPELSYRQVVQAFGQHGAAELIYLVGLYCLVSVTLNGFDVPSARSRLIASPPTSDIACRRLHPTYRSPSSGVGASAGTR